ncbi:unnamed protein product [Schistosoma turkestanicum]|nr:unnamed protein product [Schistosoma turkestanicum]
MAAQSFRYDLQLIIPLALGLFGIICLLVALLLILYYRRKRNEQDKNSPNSTTKNPKQQFKGKTNTETKFNVDETLYTGKAQFPPYPVNSQILLGSLKPSSSLTPLQSSYPITGIVAQSSNARNPTQPPFPSIQNKASFKK